MDLGLLRLLEHVHGHLGWLTVAVLLHPVVLLRRQTDQRDVPRHVRPRLRRCDLAVLLAFLFVTASAGLGIALYPEYRARVRPHLFEDAPSVGWLFERKEHLAFGALLFAWTGTAAYFAACRSKAADAPATMTAPLVRTAFLSFALSAGMALLAAIFGVAVAVTRTF